MSLDSSVLTASEIDSTIVSPARLKEVLNRMGTPVSL
jgi:hypothetical protein